RRGARVVSARRAERRRRYEASEEWAFARVRESARKDDAPATYTALLRWLERMPDHMTLGRLCETARDPALARACTALEARLFGTPNDGPTPWSGAPLLDEVERARETVRRRAVEHRAGLGPLNLA